MKLAYYARPISIDGTPQEERDHVLIRSLGFEPYPIGDDKAKALEEYKTLGLETFKPYVQRSHALFFRSFPDNSIGAGVAQEIAWAQEINIPIVEIPRQIARRTLTIEQTRDMLKELGKR